MTQLIAPRYGQGRDYGTKRRVIAAESTEDSRNIELFKHGGDYRQSHTCLFIVGGHSCSMGARGFGRDYHPASLWLFYKHPRFGWMQDKLGTGRITRDTLIEKADQINAAFCGNVAELLDPRETAWIRDGAFVVDL